MAKFNRFDQGLGFYQQDLGFLKKIEKAFRTGAKSVVKSIRENITSPLAKKTLPSKVREIGRKLDESGVNKIVGAVGLSILAPAVVGKMVAGPAAGAITKGGVASVVGKVSSNIAKSAMQDYGEYVVSKELAKEQAAAVDTLADAIKKLPEFQQVINELKAEGFSDAEIAQHWRESEAYYMTAKEEAEAVVYPLAYQQAVNSGVPAQLAPVYALQATEEVVAKQIKKPGEMSAVLPFILIAAAAALGG